MILKVRKERNIQLKNAVNDKDESGVVTNNKKNEADYFSQEFKLDV